MPAEPTQEQWAQIDACLDRKIEAIKLYRLFTNADLLTAKNAVEARVPGAFSAITQTQSFSEMDWREIDAMIQADQLIQAIKRYREQTGVGLKEAKDAVEARRSQLQIAKPGQYRPKPKGMGCGVVVALVVILLVGVLVLWLRR